ncbi:uncharacterized protein PITG_22742 [Phytophthora infestans T30-4]|uniref:RxLR effector protein n=2 Tax=Phytophthora infestans TaxID=4787 RepID=D0N1A6_PHYIT|nr:uncharacterized protein PITG_22742 [Phytophthora infestans T30-4]EEY67419.1 conserved hypothetical protein [Phytophthora infestans T30-4]KAF4046951.1 hypothetical protein GN244_ATG00599 [Phytophthora infestans]KAF4127248.1 hypothetical protein GN958_ATG23562 [Phytophthora infestans]|eukprot:XP_002906067.1 conserved hypothetical protein [Phytophthora infestans T30-4]
MPLFRLVLAAVVAVAAISNGISINANEITTARSALVHGTAPSLHTGTRELSDGGAALEERRGGGGGGGGGGGVGGGAGHITTGGISGGDTTATTGGGDTASEGGDVYGTNDVVTRHKKKNCNRFTNWLKRLFDKSIPKCPKKNQEDARRLRA